MSKIIKFIFNLWKWFLMLLGIVFLSLFIIANLTSKVNSYESLKIYKDVYMRVKNENFIRGECNRNNLLVLTKQSGKTYEIDLHINNLRKYFHEIKKNEKDEIVLIKYGGIFDSDYEIIFSDSMYYDQNKYKSIENIDYNIFICQLRNT